MLYDTLGYCYRHAHSEVHTFGSLLFQDGGGHWQGLAGHQGSHVMAAFHHVGRGRGFLIIHVEWTRLMSKERLKTFLHVSTVRVPFH
jgi:hypothetical protein